ncbi:hypothetical protein [Halorhabdus utahensis]|nr:hypothetical protein [Halorhabdus utahensis]
MTQSSQVIGAVDNYSTTFRRAVSRSRLREFVVFVGMLFGAGRRSSAACRLFRTIQRFLRHSPIYRWLTSEPDADVIVIDLRETVTVGPVLRLVQPLGSILSQWYRGSRLAPGDGPGGLTTTAANSRTAQVLQTVFEPPELSDGGDKADPDPRERTR